MKKFIERDLINYLYFDLNRMLFLIQDEIFEYDIQKIIHDFLKLKYNDKNTTIKREKYKIDNVIEYYNENKVIEKSIYIEVKSFIKKHEKINLDNIKKDINKLYSYTNEKSECYFLLVVKQSHLMNATLKIKKVIDVLNSNRKKFIFKNDINIINTRIIRSFRTIYTEKDQSIDELKNKMHKSQIRVFLFQILTKR